MKLAFHSFRVFRNLYKSCVTQFCNNPIRVLMRDRASVDDSFYKVTFEILTESFVRRLVKFQRLEILTERFVRRLIKLRRLALGLLTLQLCLLLRKLSFRTVFRWGIRILLRLDQQDSLCIQIS